MTKRWLTAVAAVLAWAMLVAPLPAQDLTTLLSQFLTALYQGSVVIGGTKSKISSTTDGIVLLTNNAGTDFTRLQFGGTTSAFPALKRVSTEIQARRADDSGGGQIFAAAFGVNTSAVSQQAGTIIFATTLFASLGTPADGSLAFCSDCTVTTAATCPATQASCVCAGSGTGAFARRVASAWYCTF